MKLFYASASGNTFCILDAREYPLPDLRKLIKSLHNRRFFKRTSKMQMAAVAARHNAGVHTPVYKDARLEFDNVKFSQGALYSDFTTHGFLYGPLPPIDSVDAGLRIFNADGSEAEVSGNGACIFVAYLKKERPEKTEFRLQFISSQKLVFVESVQSHFCIHLGPVHIQSLERRHQKFLRTLLTQFKIQLKHVYYADVGNPHWTCFVDSLPQTSALEAIAVAIKTQLCIEINLECVQCVDPQNINIRIWERGVGQTLSCGTGSCVASAIGLFLNELQSPIQIHAPGGTMIVEKKGESFSFHQAVPILREVEVSCETLH